MNSEMAYCLNRPDKCEDLFSQFRLNMIIKAYAPCHSVYCTNSAKKGGFESTYNLPPNGLRMTQRLVIIQKPSPKDKRVFPNVC